jgi:hypothetical protein
LTPVTKTDRLAKNKELIKRGNHKSALKYTAELHKTLEKEIQEGWVVPLPYNTFLAYKWWISSYWNG